MKSLLALCGTLLATSASYAAQPPVGNEALFTNPQLQQAFIKEKIKERFPESYPTMLAIANCESTGLIHWQEDGSLKPHDKGESTAAGVFQVLLGLHRDEIERLGLDMKNIDDYLEFVAVLSRNGTRFSAWNASRDCWERRLAGN